MSDTTAERPVTVPGRGTLTQRLRLATGLVLFAFVVSHLGNHALGLIDVETMQWARTWRTAVTRSVPGEIILVGSALIHMGLGVYKVLQRRTWRIGWVELVQLASGLLIPLLLMRHILGTRGAHEFFGVNDDYHYALWVMWPTEGWRQAVLILLAWVHGIVGIFQWLRLKPWFLRVRPALVVVAVLFPVLAFLGFVSAARIVQLDGQWTPPFAPDQFDFLRSLMGFALWAYVGFLFLLGAVRVGASVLERARPGIVVSYTGGPSIRVPKGLTLLEVSRTHDIPHASICGGRARCSTCRVRVSDGLDRQPPPGPAERRVLERIGAAGNVRLACQLRPDSDLTVTTLLPAHRDWAADKAIFDKYYWGLEEKVTILFGDLRGFTALSEKRLPFDVVFMLNQYLSRMAEVIEDAGGYVDKFIGDGIMAIFGMGKPPEEGARAALAAAKAMGGMLDALNQSLANDLAQPLDIAIGMETGLAILGRIGQPGKEGGSRHITALGDTVNTASRLEGACRAEGVQCLISANTLAAAIIEAPEQKRIALNVKGKTEPLEAVGLARATAIPLDWTKPVAR